MYLAHINPARRRSMTLNDEIEQLKKQQSEKLQKWLEKRSEIVKIKQAFRAMGGCALPSNSAVYPDCLQGALGREARQYFKKLERLIDSDG